MKLEKCLNELEMDELYKLYELYSLQDVDDEKENFSKETLIKRLLPMLKNSFSDYMDSYDIETISIIDEVKNKGFADEYNDLLIDDGFMYFVEDGEEDYKMVVPDELIEIFDKKNTKEAQLDLMNRYIINYIFIDLIIPVDFLVEEYINKYNLSINIDELLNSLDEKCKYRDGYIYNAMVSDNELLELEKARKENKIIKLSSAEIEGALFFEKIIVDKTSEYIGHDAAINLYHVLSSQPSENLEDDTINYLNMLNVKKNSKEIIDIYIKYYSKIRFFLLGGKDLKEILIDNTVTESINDNIKTFTLKECLKNTSDNHIDLLKTTYNTQNISSLENEITNYFMKNNIDNNYLINFNNTDVTYENFDIDFYASGLIFVFNKKIVVAKELLDTAHENINKYEKTMSKIDDNKVAEVISSILNCIRYNGAIRKEKLQELLKNEGFDLTIDDLDIIVKEYNINIINGTYSKYYDESLSDELNDLLEEKDLFGSYKPISEYNNKIYEIEDCLFDKVGEYGNELVYSIIECISIDNFTRNELYKILDFYEINLSTKDKCDLYNYLNRVKDDLPIWSKNGYSNNEMLKK